MRRKLTSLFIAMGTLTLVAIIALPAEAQRERRSERSRRSVETEELERHRHRHRPILRTRARGGEKQGFLGVGLVRLTPELRQHFGAPKQAGVMVSRIEKESPAAQAKLAVGDIITSVDGELVDSIGKLQRKVVGKEDGQQATLGIIRAKRSKKLTVKLKTRRRARVDVGPYFRWSWPEDASDFDVQIDTEALSEAMENLEKHFEKGLESPLLKRQIERTREMKKLEKQLEKRIQKLEKRLKSLEKRFQTKRLSVKKTAKSV